MELCHCGKVLPVFPINPTHKEAVQEEKEYNANDEHSVNGGPVQLVGCGDDVGGQVGVCSICFI